MVFHTPYIICNDWMLERLEEICGEVDSVTMMTNSVANDGNPFGASDYDLNREEILETGVEILEYDRGISYHGKCFVIDDRLSGIGSFNWDMRSAYVDTELMLVVDSEELNAQLRSKMQEYEEDALTVAFEFTSVELSEYLIAILLGVMVIPIVELVKLITRNYRKSVKTGLLFTGGGR